MSENSQIDVEIVESHLKQLHPYSDLGVEGAYARLMEFEKYYLFEIFAEIILAHESLRKVTAKAILHIDAQQGLPLVLPLLEDKNSDIRIHICGLLSQFGDERAIPYRIEMLNDEDPNVRYTTTFALGKIGSKEVISILQSVKQNDTGTDYEGRPIGDMASRAIQNIISRN